AAWLRGGAAARSSDRDPPGMPRPEPIPDGDRGAARTGAAGGRRQPPGATRRLRARHHLALADPVAARAVLAAGAGGVALVQSDAAGARARAHNSSSAPVTIRRAASIPILTAWSMLP